MEIQVQGSVLVDGEWVSRSADVYQILSRNQHQEDDEMDDVAAVKPHEAPEMGVLSKTVIGSPLYTTIIPANIRHKDLEDVLFIGEDFVQLKEICDRGHLRHIATMSDLKGKILAAKAFGNPRKVQVNTSCKSPLLKMPSLHRGRRSTTEAACSHLPLEVLVLTLTTRTLMFLWATDNNLGPTTFVQKTVQLPTAASRFNRPGQFLAIDPRCRAIAVAAAEGCFMLYKTKTMDMWRRDLEVGIDDVPIIEEAQYPVEGRIMHMDFLSTGNNDDDSHVVLVFVVVHEGKSKVASYDWDLNNSLDIEPRKTRSVLDFENRNPSLLIPLNRNTDFLFVQSESITICSGILAGPPLRNKVVIPDHFLTALRPGGNKGMPLWVQWDRAPRNPGFPKEAFYLAREDGAIIYVELGGVANPLEISDAGSWPYPIDTAFACLKADGSEFAQSYPDVLVAGGFGSDGYLCKVGAWPKEYANQVPYSETNAFNFVGSLPSWAPLTDVAVTRLENMPLPYDRGRASLYVSNSKGPHGEVSQLRRGLRALVDETFGGLKGSTGLWILDYSSTTPGKVDSLRGQDYATFVVSVPGETLVLRASRTQGDGSYSHDTPGSSQEDGPWKIEQPTQDGLIRDAETVAACPISDNIAVQITYQKATFLQRPQLKELDSATFSNTLLGAATKPGVPFIVVALYEGTQPILEVIPFSTNEPFRLSENRSRYHLAGDPTCVDIIVSEVDVIGPLIFVGIANVGFSIFKVDKKGSLIHAYQTIQPHTGHPELQQIYESAALLKARGHEKLVCGTRTGLLITIDLADLGITTSPPSRQSSTLSIIKMGSTAVYITPNKTDCSMAFVACGADFCRIHLSNFDSAIHVDSIWLDDPKCPAYLQGALNAIDQVPVSSEGQEKGLGGFIFGVFGDQMVYTRFDYDIRGSTQLVPSLSPEDGKIVPRKLSTTDTPVKLMVAEDLPHHLIVVTKQLKEERTPTQKYRTMLSTIKVMDLLNDGHNTDVEIKDEPFPGTPRNNLRNTEVPLKHYEKVYSMVRWIFLGEKDRQHALVVIGTGIMESPGRETGRRLILNVGKSGLDLKDKKRFEKPVRCIAVYDNQHIVSVIGSTLQLEQIERAEAARWKPRGQIQLPSPGVHMTVSENYIYVSTSHDSHLCFQVTKLPEPLNETTFKITQIFSDTRQRSSLRHLTYKTPMLLNIMGLTRSDIHTQATFVLLTDKSASLTCLLHPHAASKQSATTTMFEACLPRSIIRLQRGDIRPPWRRTYKKRSATSKPCGVLDDDLLGACTDGTIYSFSLLSGQALHLLRFLQNLVEAKRKRDPALQFSPVKQKSGHIYNLLQNRAEGSQDGDIKAKDVDSEMQIKGPAAPRFRHVDGDLLIRFFHQGGTLQQLLEEGCDEDVLMLFFDKAKCIVAIPQSRDEEKAVLKVVEDWVKEIIMPLL